MIAILLGGCVSNKDIQRAEDMCKYDEGLKEYHKVLTIPREITCQNGNKILVNK
tara:strand:+ start:69 stop:230 length:162 start_codon:yes stop_codon:yes gene_type:complete